MFKAVLVDLDGLLINSEELYFEANMSFFSKYKFKYTPETHAAGLGQKFDNWAKTLVKTSDQGKDMLYERDQIFLHLSKKRITLMPGAKQFLSSINNKFRVALVTTSTKSMLHFIFSKIKIERYFDYIVTGDMVQKGKPDPECYLFAAKKLKVKHNECIVFEDSPNGIIAGKKAYMKVVAVPNRFVEINSICNSCNLLLLSLNDFSIKNIDSMFNK